MPKRVIPAAPASGQDRGPFDRAVKENLELIIGQRGGRIEPLASTATLADVVAKVNELIAQLQ